MAEFETDYLAHHDGERSLDVIYSKSLDEATNYLEHYQIKGAKHGVRRFQNYDGTLTAAGRERYGIGPPREKKTEESSVKKAVESVKKKVKGRKEKSIEEEKERRYEYIRNHPKQLPKFKDVLSEQEANEIVRQIEFDRKLKSIRETEIQAGWKKIQSFSNNVQTISNLLNNSKNAYNTAAEINNALVDAGVIKKGKKWVRIGKNDQQQKSGDN